MAQESSIDVATVSEAVRGGPLPFSICQFLWIRFWGRAAVYSGQIKALDDHRKVGLSENSVPLNPMINDHYPF